MKKDIFKVFLISFALFLFLGEVRFFLNSSDKMEAIIEIFSFRNIRISTTFVVAFLGYSVWTYIVLKKHYSQKKKSKVVLFLAIGLIISITLRYFLDEVIGAYYFGEGNYNPKTKLIYYFLDNCYFSILYGSIGMIYFFVQNSFKNEKEKLELVAEHKATQLKFLKNQVNPHFLFNSLNNIYSLIYQKSDNALPAVDKLSKLLRYSLYEADQKATLKKEFEQIQYFIDLQSLRREKAINYTLESSLKESEIQIPPLLLIPFVENAFKHGDLHNASHPISIRLFEEKNHLVFEVKNMIKIQQKDKVGGIGLTNIQKRLELLYGENHTFDIEEKNDRFTATLKIPTSL